ncbi:CsbD family protein [Streptomyces sp. NPDC001941]|uniref:CsbD family protein n=1 Tax=Streptomyces sp. NPDC001941 TaxID=3154659 RepID=UPI003325E8A7
MSGDSAMDKVKGKAKEWAGKATGDDRMAAEGQTDQAKAKAKDAVDKAKERVEGVVDSLRNKRDDS